jgi:hypothetical protein
MSMALSAFGRILVVSSACAVAVRGCQCPSLITVCRIEMVVFTLMNMAPNIICEMLRTAPLMGISSFPAMYIWPPARLRDLGSKRYNALLWIARTMSLAQWVRTVSSCVDMKS